MAILASFRRETIDNKPVMMKIPGTPSPLMCFIYNEEADRELMQLVRSSKFHRKLFCSGIGGWCGRTAFLDCVSTAEAGEDHAAFLVRARLPSRTISAIRSRLLASTAAPTNTSKRSRPWARQRFMPRPRKSTEMRPSMPARKR